MSTMSAALYDGKGAMGLTEIPRPDLGPGDALVRVRSAGICGSDLLFNSGRTEPDRMPAGHEVAGEIAEVGAGVAPSRIGERVAVESIGHGLACLDCWYCRTGQYFLCPNKSADEGGGFAEYMKRGAAGCYTLPDNVSWEEAALVEPFAVAIHSVRRGEMSGGETVAVLGAGTIGLCAVAAARALGAGTVIVTAKHRQQAEMALRLGADQAVSPEGGALWDAVAAASDGRGADLTLESVGGRTSEPMKQAVRVTRMQGRIATMGNFHVPVTLDWMAMILKELSVVWSAVYGIIDGRNDYEIAVDLMASGRVDLKQLVTHTFPLGDIQRGFETSYDKSSGAIKVQIHS